MATNADTTPDNAPAGTGKTRRDALAAFGFTGLAGLAAAGFVRPEVIGAAAAAPSPDAELLALVERFNAIEREINATFVGDHAPRSAADVAAEARRDELRAQQEPLFARIIDLRATTLPGFQARAEMLRICDTQIGARGAPEGYWNDQISWSLVRDLLEEA